MHRSLYCYCCHYRCGGATRDAVEISRLPVRVVSRFVRRAAKRSAQPARDAFITRRDSPKFARQASIFRVFKRVLAYLLARLSIAAPLASGSPVGVVVAATIYHGERRP